MPISGTDKKKNTGVNICPNCSRRWSDEPDPCPRCGAETGFGKKSTSKK